MSDAPFIPFYPSDWLAGTSGLTPAERGVYITLCCLIYENFGPVEHDDRRLARHCGCPKPTFRKTLDALIADGKITLGTDGMLSNARCEREIRKRAGKSQKARVAALERWKAHGRKTEQDQLPLDADAMRMQCERNANQNQNHREEPDVSSQATETLEVRTLRAKRWIRTGARINEAMDRPDVVLELLGKGYSRDKLERAGFTLPDVEPSNVVTITGARQ